MKLVNESVNQRRVLFRFAAGVSSFHREIALIESFARVGARSLSLSLSLSLFLSFFLVVSRFIRPLGSKSLRVPFILNF